MEKTIDPHIQWEHIDSLDLYQGDSRFLLYAGGHIYSIEEDLVD